MADLASGWGKHRGREQQVHQICHRFGYGADDGYGTLVGEDVWCAAFYETQVAPEVRASWEQIGLIRFVSEPPEQNDP